MWSVVAIIVCAITAGAAAESGQISLFVIEMILVLINSFLIWKQLND